MTLSRRFIWRLKLFAVFVALTSCVGPIYILLFGGPDFIENPYHTMLNGFVGGSLFWGIEFILVPSRYGEPLRRMSFIPATLFRILVMTLIILTISPIAFFIVSGKYDPTTSLQAGPSVFIFAVGMVTLLYGILQIVRVVGPRVLLNIFFGRYRRPVKEARIFLFLDIQGSTAMSEHLGDIGVQELINQFFFDITEPIMEWGGEIHRYIGDEVVVTWPLDKGLKDASCLRCCLAIRAAIAGKAARYQALFGIVPDFRIGLHGGDVVASQCGDVKQEMVYFGDTINTASRIEHYCKEVGRKLLISEDLAAQLPNRSVWQFEDVGAVQLRGRSSEMSLLAVKGQP